jgi:hypothetical protein
MSALGRPRKSARGELASKTARELIASAAYAALAVLAKLFGTIFWTLEQHRWRLADELERRRT